MRFVYILEDDPKFQKELIDAVLSIDPMIQVRLFPTLKKFAGWVKYMMTTGTSAIAQGGEVPSWIKAEPLAANEEHQLSMIVSKIEFLGSKQIPLMEKTRDLFIERKICTKEDPTVFVLTTFEDPQFKIKDLEDRILSNIIFKPFDKLILAQHLTFAIDGRHPPSKYTIANQKMTAHVEMLKEVQMVAVSEIGFVTASNRPIEKGKISKYYGSQFVSERQKSLMAVTVDCRQVPDKTDEYLCSFLYFGAGPSQLSTMRKNLRAKPTDFDQKWETLLSDVTRSNRPIGAVMIDEEPAICDEIIDSLKRNFEPFQFTKYQSLTEFLTELDPKLVDSKAEPPPPKAFPPSVVAEFIFDQTGGKIEEIKTTSKDPVIFGKKIADIIALGTFWSHALGQELLAKWKEWLNTPKDITLCLKIEKNTYYIKPSNINRDATTKKITVKFDELSTQDRTQFILNNSRIPKNTDLIFISHRFLQSTDGEKWLKIKEVLKLRSGNQEFQPRIILLAAKEYTDAELVQYGSIVSDILYKPIDRSYLLRKVRVWNPELKVLSDDVNIGTIAHTENIFTASPVQISEISEAGLVMQYYRAISLGSFRDFVLWQPYEIGAPRVIATCNYTEETSQKGIFNNHFVFFGMTDQFLKTIRIWIRDNYIIQKEQGG